MHPLVFLCTFCLHPLLGAGGATSPDFDSATVFDWSGVPEKYPGIKHQSFTVTQPRPNVINAMRVDLANPDIRLHATGKAANWGTTMPNTGWPFVIDLSAFTICTERKTTSAYLTGQRNAGRNMVAAINASGWQPFAELGIHQNSYPYADNLGLLISEGIVVSPPRNNYTSLVFYKDSTADFIAANATTDTSNMLTVVTGGSPILVNGSTTGDTALHPRTGTGLSKDRHILFLVTIDGRQSGYSEGATTRELGEWLRYLGAWSGLNMDGGGSTTMVLRNPQSRSIQVLNSPSDGSQRKNGSNLGIYYISQPE